MEPKSHQTESKADKMEPKAPTTLFCYAEKVRQMAINKKHKKQNVRLDSLEVLGPDPLLSGIMLKNERCWEPFGSQQRLKVMEKAKQKAIPEKLKK